ncbi:MAG: DUF3093 domain-containing protein [Micrococcaceae bacterium]
MTDSTNPAPSQPAGALYVERLTPSWWLWIVALMFSGLSYMVLAPLGVAWGIGAAVGMYLLCTIILLATTPKIVVTESTLQVGRAGIEREHLGPVTGYRDDDATYQRGPGLHGLAFMCLRGWISPVVRIQITDRRDRTPYWLTSTRRPEELVAALNGSMFSELIAEEAAEPADDDIEGRIRHELNDH